MSEKVISGKGFRFRADFISAVMKYSRGVAPLDCGGQKTHENGNGSLMRISPLVLYIRSEFGKNAFGEEHASEAFTVVHNVSRQASDYASVKNSSNSKNFLSNSPHLML